MKLRHKLIFVSLLLAAALFGWLLPSAVFRISDGIEAGKSSALQIKEVDLRYQSDLDPARRLRLIRQTSIEARYTALEHGIYLQEHDVREICAQFLLDVTGRSYPDSSFFDVSPTLITYSGEGTMLVWNVGAVLNDAWHWEAVVDDQTGLILRCSFEGVHEAWDSLFRDYPGSGSGQSYAAIRISDAVRRHFNDRLSADLTSRTLQLSSDDLEYTADLLLSEDEQLKYIISLVVVSEEGIIMLN